MVGLLVTMIKGMIKKVEMKWVVTIEMRTRKSNELKRDPVRSVINLTPTGVKGEYTQWVHYELIVGPETICLAHTQQVNSGHI